MQKTQKILLGKIGNLGPLEHKNLSSRLRNYQMEGKGLRHYQMEGKGQWGQVELVLH